MRALSWASSEDITLLAGILDDDGIVLGTCDTVVGLLARTSAAAVAELDVLKGRIDKPYIILIGSSAMLGDFTDTIHPACAALTALCWPGPLTVIVKARPTLVRSMQSPAGTVALRVPNHAGLQRLLTKVPAVFSTSANTAGRQAAQRVIDVEARIVAGCRAIITEGSDDSADGDATPSTIVDCSGCLPRLVREGLYPVGELAARSGFNVSNG